MATCRTPRGGRAHDCLTSAEVGGLTLAMLHWMFTDWRLGRSESKSRPARPPGHPAAPRRSNEQLASYGVDLASVIPNDDADGIKDGARELPSSVRWSRRF